MIGRLSAMLTRSAWARRAPSNSVIALVIILILLDLRRYGERAGCLTEQHETMERGHDAHQRMLELVASRCRLHHDLAGAKLKKSLVVSNGIRQTYQA